MLGTGREAARQWPSPVFRPPPDDGPLRATRCVRPARGLTSQATALPPLPSQEEAHAPRARREDKAEDGTQHLEARRSRMRLVGPGSTDAGERATRTAGSGGPRRRTTTGLDECVGTSLRRVRCQWEHTCVSSAAQRGQAGSGRVSRAGAPRRHGGDSEWACKAHVSLAARFESQAVVRRAGTRALGQGEAPVASQVGKVERLELARACHPEEEGEEGGVQI